MIALQITDIKNFMSKLLIQDLFDHFLTSEVSITTYNTFHIDGHINKDYYSSEEIEELGGLTLSTWKSLKPICYDLIKGTKTPLRFKIIFLLSPENIEKILKDGATGYTQGDINGLFINIKYDENTLTCITGTSLKLFTLDKSLEEYWDQTVIRYFKNAGISYE